MTDKDDLRTDLINILSAYLRGDDLEEAKMRIDILMEPYHIERHGTEMVVYEGDKNTQILARFLAAKVAAGLSPRSIKYYRHTITAFFERVQKPYDLVTADDIRFYLALRVQRDKVSKTTANNEYRAASSFYGWLQKEEILLRNPMAKVDKIKETKKKKRAYDLMDLEKIRLGCESARERAIVEVLASTWCRVGELVLIRIDEIRNGKIIVHGKGDKEREVYLNARAQLAVDTYLGERSDSNPYLFPRAKYAGDLTAMSKGKKRKQEKLWYQDPDQVDETRPMDKGSVESIVRTIGKKAGVAKSHPHRFRRTGATMALRAGMPITTVSKLLGHESLETTQIYLDISDDELAQAHSKYVT